MKQVVMQFLNADGTEFHSPVTSQYDGSGTGAEPYEAFWAISQALADLAQVAAKFPAGPADTGPPDIDIPKAAPLGAPLGAVNWILLLQLITRYMALLVAMQVARPGDVLTSPPPGVKLTEFGRRFDVGLIATCEAFVP